VLNIVKKIQKNPPLRILIFGLFQIYPNGGGKVLHAWQEDLDRLSEEENQAFAEEFVTESFRNGRPGPTTHRLLFFQAVLRNENISSGSAEPQFRIVAPAL
jgi:hypothetical protein